MKGNMRPLWIAGAVTFTALFLLFIAADEGLMLWWAMNHSWSGEGPVLAARQLYGYHFLIPIFVSLGIAVYCLRQLFWFPDEDEATREKSEAKAPDGGLTS